MPERLETQRPPSKLHVRKNDRWVVRGYNAVPHPVWADPLGHPEIPTGPIEPPIDPPPIDPPPNQAPLASFISSTNGLEASFNAWASTDSDGTIVLYAWDFGDGGTVSGMLPTMAHTYGVAGTYTVTLTVTDNDGATGTTTRSVMVSVLNQSPLASFTSTTDWLDVSFDASTSSDPDGTIASYGWDFGDGTITTGVTAAHTYGAAGTYTVTLLVTDNGGLTGTTARSITVTTPPPPPVNQAPSASFTSTSSGLFVSFNATGSSDPDGTINSYAWNFGDGATGTGALPTHTYGAGGVFTVTLTVTDDDGATGTTTRQVTAIAPPPPNLPPTASFTATTNALNAAFNAAASNDPDGSIISYAWTFGDGTTGSGVSPTKTYGAAGTYSVNLTVTDNGGLSGTVTTPVTVTTPPPPPGDGLGNAPLGTSPLGG